MNCTPKTCLSFGVQFNDTCHLLPGEELGLPPFKECDSMCRTSLTMKSKPMSTANMQKPTSSKYSHGHKAYEHCEYAKGPAFALVQFNAARIQDAHFLREAITSRSPPIVPVNSGRSFPSREHIHFGATQCRRNSSTSTSSCEAGHGNLPESRLCKKLFP